MSESMIERVAKALFKFEGDGSDFHKISAVQRDYWLGAARAAIEAMRPYLDKSKIDAADDT